MADTKKEDLIYEFSNPYTFEGKEYKELDLSGVEKINTLQMMDAQEQLPGDNIVPEVSSRFYMLLAAEATGLPAEFFNNLPAKDGIGIKVIVQHFFLDL